MQHTCSKEKNYFEEERQASFQGEICSQTVSFGNPLVGCIIFKNIKLEVVINACRLPTGTCRRFTSACFVVFLFAC